MAKRPKGSKKAKSRQRSSQRSQVEWVGGRFSLPIWITEGEPYRPDLVFWLDTQVGLILVHQLLHPDDPMETVIDPLREAIERSPLPPASVRVEDRALAERLQAELGEQIRGRVAPIPEAEDVLDRMMSTLVPGGEERSYLEGGRVEPEAVARFFRAAAALYRVSPWDIVQSDGHVLAMESADFRVENACLSVIGQMGESRGFLVFESFEDFGRFAERGFGLLDDEGSVAAPRVSGNSAPGVKKRKKKE